MSGPSDFLVFAVSLIALYYGAKHLTAGAKHIAKVMGISEFVIGATVVAFGTSLPELASSTFAVSQGHPEIAVGNAMGSNLANIGLALGLSALLYPIFVNRKITDIDIPFLIASAVSLLAAFLDGSMIWIEGLLLIAMYIAFLYREVSFHMAEERTSEEQFQPRYIALFLTGTVLLYFGAEYLVLSVQGISDSLDISNAVAAFIFVAVGTSVPEIATSIVAASQKRGDIAIGNVLGSNTMNSLVVMGTSSLIGELTVDAHFLTASLSIMIMMSLLIGFMALNNRVSRLEGTMLFLIYCLAVLNIA